MLFIYENKNIYQILYNLIQFIEQENFKGYDPYDALNSPFLKLCSFDSKFLKIAFIQTLKRFPINLRPFFGIKKGYNPKGIGLFLWGYAKLYHLEKKEDYLKKISFLINLLDELKSTGYSGNCWGYNFDWQSRAFYVPKFTPTIVNSSFIGHTLIDTYRYTGNQMALDMAISIKDFILRDLNKTREDDTICFSYTPIDKTMVHNANLLGASLLIRLFHYTQESEVKDAALESLKYSMKYQRDDGSWYYAETNFQNWIDSFHTGFNLQSLLYFLDEGFASEYRADFEKGVWFYLSNFFLNDGTPKYYHNKTYPIDVHSPAQAIVLFSRLGDNYRNFIEKIVQWLLSNLQHRDGYFYFQKKKFYTNKIPYIRWGQAWSFHALTEFALSQYRERINNDNLGNS